MIKGQKIYMGPRLHAFGIGYGNVFYGGVQPRLKEIIAQCPAVGELLVPIKQCAKVRAELAFDYTHNMRGTTGRHVTFYREVENWLRKRSQKTQQTTPTNRGQTSCQI